MSCTGGDKKEIAFFDFDGTIVSSEMHQAIWWMICHLPNRFQSYIKRLLFVVSLPVLGVVHAIWGELASIRMLIFIGFWNVSEEDTLFASQQIFSKFDVVVRPEMREEIERHQKLKRPVYVISGNALPLIRPFCKQKLGVVDVVSTELEVFAKSGRRYYSGLCSGPVCVLEEKVKRMKKLLQNEYTGDEIIHYYGNSKNDIPSLHAAHNAYPVKPDTTLANHSLQQKWTQQFVSLKSD